MSKINKETFLKLCPYVSKSAQPNDNDYIYSTRRFLENYEYDYSHAIVTYMKACGCKIHRTNWNFFGGFYIYYTEPQRYVDPSEFIDNYKGGVHIDSRTVGLIYFFTIPSFILLFVLLIMKFCG